MTRTAAQDPWFLSNLEGRPRPQFSHVSMPSIPDVETQRRYTGLSGRDNLFQGFRFWQIARSSIDPGPETAVLDFGCGWGRVGRFWLRDLAPSQIYLTDVMSDAVDLVERSGSEANLAQCEPQPPLPWDVQFDVITAYSVFSHLNEALYLGWMAEFYRRLKPGGCVIFTSRAEHFIAAVKRWQDGGRKTAFNAGMLPDWRELEESYAEGKFMFFTKDGGGGELAAEFYGQSFVPEKYVKESSARLGFASAERLVEPGEVDQAVFRLVK